MMTKTRGVLLALVVAGLAGCASEDSGSAADAAPEESTTIVPSPTTEAVTRGPVTFEADASQLAAAFVPLDAGTYRVDTVGTPFSFTTDEPLFVQPNGRGIFVLTHPGSNGPDDRDIVVLRLSALSDPAEPVAPIEESEDGWPANDFSGWLESLSDEIVISDRQDTTLGDLDATYVELELGETDCSSGSPCTFGTNNLIETKFLVPQSKYRIWMVDQDDEDVLAVIVGVNREADLDWFDTANEILETFAFDAIGPNPVFEADGVIELSFLGGIRTELAQPATVIQEPAGFGAIAPFGQPGDAEFLIAPNDADGNAVETSDDLLAVLEEGNVEVTEIEPTEIDGFEARIFEIGSKPSQPLLTRTANSDAPWTPPPRGQVWLVEHPERGLLMITAEAFANPDSVFPIVLAQTEPIVESLEFIELG